MKNKTTYSPSRQEFFFIAALLIVVVTALFLKFLIFPQFNAFVMEREYYRVESLRLDGLITDNQQLESLEAEDLQARADIAALRELLPEYLSEEDALSAVYEALGQSGLTLTGITFDVLMSADSAGFASSIAQNTASTAQPDPETADILVEFRSMHVSYSGTYEQLRDFVSALTADNRFIRGVRVSRSEQGTLSGQVTVLLVSAGDLQKPEEYPPYEFLYGDIPGGAVNPFAAYESYNLPVIAQPNAASAADEPEFFIVLNTYDDSAEKVLMGRYPATENQLRHNENSTAAAELRITGGESGYGYTLEMNGAVLTGTFTVRDDAISVSVLSRDRTDPADMVGLDLSVINETDLPLNLYVAGDDAADPRLRLSQITGQVKIVS